MFSLAKKFKGYKIPSFVLVLLKLLFTIIAFYVVFRKLNLEILITYIAKSNVFFLILAFLASTISLIFSSLRSKFYLSEYGLNLSTKFCIKLYYVGSLFNIILPGGIGGDGYKIYILSKTKNFSKLMSLRIMLYERVNGFFILALFGLVLILMSTYFSVILYLNYLTYISLIAIVPCYLIGIKYLLRDKVKVAMKAALFSCIVQLFQIIMILFIIFSLISNNNMGIAVGKQQMIIDFIVLFIIASIIAIIPISIGGAGLRELTFLYGSKFLHGEYQELSVVIALISFFIYVVTALPGFFFVSMKGK